MRALLITAAALSLSACIAVDVDEADWDHWDETTITHHGTEGIAGRALPFSKAVEVGDTIYLSGELGIDPETRELVPGGAGPETTQIFVNIAATLSDLDADLSDIVKCSVFLGDMADYGEMNAAYSAALPDPKPARSTLGANGLALGAAVEIECLAVRS